ncbi:SET domain-containing protein 4 [Coccinella septempunctata]|uniref:SET domain-containing protein 4 n=1 Tax=Coccinella septempunctata TaxID=41139 RepID=UPI001D07F703|nr:SET domain-containing protein 4 [Coccinella septempunctata]
MGRTQRIRNRNKTKCSDSAKIVENISLMKWMGTFNWKNTSKIFCKEFEATGRGVTSSKDLCSNESLIAVPFQLLITYSTLSASEDFMSIFEHDVKLGIQDILAAFLVLEKHKKNQSYWRYYLESLPIVTPILPWFSSSEEIEYFPKELRELSFKCKNNFKESFERIRRSVHVHLECKCCKEKIIDILSLESYKWGYVMVNTRGVYVDPEVIRKFSKLDILFDEPRIAMFPMMDMFNHSDIAENMIEFTENSQGLFYQLSTLTNHKKYDQIFISYGRHDNTELFTEYGFYLPNNSNDKIRFKPSEILKCLNLRLNNFQYNFLRKNEFLETEELFINMIGPSFKLKGFLYVALNENTRNYSGNIFSEVYDESFKEDLPNYLLKLLDVKIEEYKTDYWKFRNKFRINESVCQFLQSTVKFVESVRKEINSFI